MAAAIAGAALANGIKELIHGNFQQSDELIKGVEAGMLAPVLYVHDGTRCAVYKLCQVFLCPALCLSFALDFLAQRMEVKLSCVLVHFYLTPILFYISGESI